MFNRTRLTLSIEATQVRLMIVRGRRVVRWGEASLPESVVRNGQIVRPEPFGQAVAELVREIKAPRRNVIVSLSGQQTLVRTLTLPSVPARLLEGTVLREARRELPLPLEDLDLAWQVIDDGNASRTQVFVVGVPKEAVDNCVIGLQGAGLRPSAIDLKPLALVRAVNLPDVLIANLETQAGDVVLVRGFIPHVIRSLALPGGSTRPLAERVEGLVAEIQRTLTFYDSTLAKEHAPWSPQVCLTGALGDQGLVQSQVGARWPLVEMDLPLSPPDDLPLLSHLVNLGLALKA